PGYLADAHLAPVLALTSPSDVRVGYDWGVYYTWEYDYRPVCELLHEVFGNPFRSISFVPSWRTTAVVTLARAAYDDRVLPAGTLDPDRLAVLSDALEEAGCDNADVLAHLRGPGPHVRGCWVLDLLLDKK